MNRLIRSLLVISLLAFATAAVAQPANVGWISDEPAATLLLPYFQVNLNDPNGWTTYFSVNNASATAVLGHVTVWSDLAVPVLAFNIYLTGYDVQVVNMRDIINGILPRTASAGQDPSDQISPKGPLSQDINFATCTGQLPLPLLSAQYVSHLQASLSGGPSPLFSGNCSGLPYGDGMARGYVTVDTVNNCTLRVPSTPLYISNDITFQNVLWGDYLYTNNLFNLARGDALIHIHSNLTDPLTTTSGNYTFYGAFDGWNATDHRQPLAGTYATRYTTSGNFPNGTSIVVWRDPKVVQSPFTCGVPPAWYPLNHESIVAFDVSEHPTDITVGTNNIGAATQRRPVGGAIIPTPYPAGWLYLNLNTTVAAAGSNPSIDPAAAQAAVSVVHDNLGHYSVGYRAIALDTSSNANHTNP
jgi:hypothetical protein